MPYEKVGKNDPVCIADQVPFEIPDSWEWVHLSDIAISGLGKTLNKSMDEGTDTPYLCSINVYWTGIDLSTVKTAKFTQTDREKYLLQKGDLLICEGGDVGRSAIWNYDTEMYYQNALHRVRFLGKINPYFFLYLLECYRGLKIIEEYSKGVTIKHFVQSSLNSMFLPLPPLNEQQRIVDKINEILTIVANYDTTYSRVTKLNEAFPDALKRSILQWAIQGKLVPQDPNDEPASVLLERIREEKQRLVKEGKIKKDKHESIIFRRDNSYYEKRGSEEICIDDEIPFEIPTNWSWVRASSLGTMFRGRGIKRTETVSQGCPCIRYGEIYTTYETYFKAAVSFIPESLNKYCLHFSTGDIVFTLTGENKVDIAKAVVFIGTGRIAAGSDLAVWTSHGMNPLYLVYYMASPYCIDCKRKTATGDIIVHISTTKVGDFLIPVPPFEEQSRIVSNIERLLNIIATL